jgi:hypothetical protein
MDDHEYVSYEDFGRKFYEIAVTEQRVAAAFADIAGNDFEIGPFRHGPGKFARISAKVNVLRPEAERTVGDTITFDIRIPLAIDLVVDLRLDRQRFKVTGEIGLRAWARAAEPLLLILDVAKPRPSDVTVSVLSSSMRGEILRILAGVDAEIQRFIAKYVGDEIDSPASKKAQVIDVAKRLDSAWTGI